MKLKILTRADPLIAKVMVHANDRIGASKKMSTILSKAKLQGPPTNLHFLRDVVSTKGNFTTIFPPNLGLFTDSWCSLPRGRYFDQLS
jgi:biotin carboxylase